MLGTPLPIPDAEYPAFYPMGVQADRVCGADPGAASVYDERSPAPSPGRKNRDRGASARQSRLLQPGRQTRVGAEAALVLQLASGQ
jgi:hypothetical protein